MVRWQIPALPVLRSGHHVSVGLQGSSASQGSSGSFVFRQSVIYSYFQALFCNRYHATRDSAASLVITPPTGTLVGAFRSPT